MLPVLPHEIQLLIGQQCLATYTDQELWFGLAQTNRLFRALVEDDVIAGRNSTTDGEPLKKPLQTSTEAVFVHEFELMQKDKGPVLVLDLRPYDASCGPHLWFTGSGHFGNNEFGDETFGPDSESKALNFQGFDHANKHHAIFKSLPQRYLPYSADDKFVPPYMLWKAHFDRERRAEHLSSFGIPLLKNEEPTQACRYPRRLAGWSLDLRAASKGAFKRREFFCQGLSATVDYPDRMSAPIFVTIDWREMWTKKLARERVLETFYKNRADGPPWKEILQIELKWMTEDSNLWRFRVGRQYFREHNGYTGLRIAQDGSLGDLDWPSPFVAPQVSDGGLEGMQPQAMTLEK